MPFAIRAAEVRHHAGRVRRDPGLGGPHPSPRGRAPKRPAPRPHRRPRGSPGGDRQAHRRRRHRAAAGIRPPLPRPLSRAARGPGPPGAGRESDEPSQGRILLPVPSLPERGRPGVPRLAPAGPHARAVPAARGWCWASGGPPPRACRAARAAEVERLVAGRTRGLLPDGQPPGRHHRRVPAPGSAPRRAGPVLPVPALPLPRGAPPAGGPRQPHGPSSRPRWCRSVRTGGSSFIVEEPAEGAAQDAFLQRMHAEILPALVAVDGVAGAWSYGTTPVDPRGPCSPRAATA